MAAPSPTPSKTGTSRLSAPKPPAPKSPAHKSPASNSLAPNFPRRTPFVRRTKTLSTINNSTSVKSLNTGPGTVASSPESNVVIVIDDNTAYCRGVWSTIGLGLVNILIGGVNMMAIAYATFTGDIHAGVCTAGFHLFCAEAILSLNNSNGCTMPMRRKHRRFAHVFLQVCGVICAAGGATYLVVKNERIIGTAHGYCGLAAVGLAGLSFLSGPLALCMSDRYAKILHMSIGIPTFLVSSICLCLGIITPGFTFWATSPIVFILIGFVCFNTAFIVIAAFIKCVSRV